MIDPIAIAVVGVGKIARDQHLPTIASSDRFSLCGAVSLHDPDLPVPVKRSLTDLKTAVPDLQAVTICTPPLGRIALVEEALSLGLHVMLEKPPAATLSEAERFSGMAQEADRTLFLAWHSREAAGVELARAWIADRTVKKMRIDWLENVREWHPGQEWIWEPGIGVFDPGINALSILTRISNSVLTVTNAELAFPKGRAAPIAAEITMSDKHNVPINARFSFDQRGPQTWSIKVETSEGLIKLFDGGSRLTIAGQDIVMDQRSEYTRLYSRFADLIFSNKSDADLTPFRLVADAFLLGRRREIEAFSWDLSD